MCCLVFVYFLHFSIDCNFFFYWLSGIVRPHFVQFAQSIPSKVVHKRKQHKYKHKEQSNIPKSSGLNDFAAALINSQSNKPLLWCRQAKCGKNCLCCIYMSKHKESTTYCTCTRTHSNTPHTSASNEVPINHSWNIFVLDMKSFGNHPLPTSAAVQRAEGGKRTGKKEPLPIVAEECLWGPIKACFRGLPVMSASFSRVPPTHGSIVCVLASHVLSLCHPAESVTPGSKSKLNLILIHLIEEPDPKVEAVFDLLQGIGRKD